MTTLSIKTTSAKMPSKGQFTVEYKQITYTSPLAEVMMGRKQGDRFVFGGVNYEITVFEAA